MEQQVSSLPAGTTFNFDAKLPHLKNGTVIRSTACSTTCEFSELKDGNWLPKREPFANSMLVTPTGAVVLKITAAGTATTVGTEIKKRGKETLLPKGEFMVADLAKLNSLQTANAHQRLLKLVEEGKVQRLRTVSGGRGRAKVIYAAV